MNTTAPPSLFRSLILPLALSLSAAGCTEPWPTPAPVDAVAFASDHEAWRLQRQERAVTPPGGPVLWIGLWELPEGDTRFGSDPSLPVVLPAQDAAPVAGTLRRRGGSVLLLPATGAGIEIHGEGPVNGPTELRHDRTPDPTRLALGSLGLRVHAEPGTDRLWLRAWDEDLPKRATFTLPEYFPVDPEWRVRARFDAYDEPEILRLPDVTGGTVEFRVPGELVFRRNGREHRLMATASETSSSFFIMMWDSTALSKTYQAGRYVRAEFPDSTGWTTIDFNRAYNAPCVFTAHSVCALPPPPNRLKLAVTAGEMRPAKYPEMPRVGG